MVVLFTEGFETGAFNEWTNPSPYFSIVAAPVHGGNFAALGNFDGAGTGPQTLIETLATPQNSLNVQGYFKFESDALTVSGQLITIDAAGHNHVGIAQLVYVNGQYYWTAGISDVVSSNSLAFVIDRTHWYCIELEVSIGTEGVVNVYVDGVLVATATGDNSLFGRWLVSALFPSLVPSGLLVPCGLQLLIAVRSL